MNFAVAEPQQISSIFQIPDYLIKEEIKGIAYPYKGYRTVLSEEKTLNEIIGSSHLQGFIISYLIRVLNKNLNEKQYVVYTNEIGLHIKHKTNPACDIAIFEKQKINAQKISKHYTTIAPKIIIEVDVDIEVSDNQGNTLKETNYIVTKTETLLDFGVETVIWVLTESKKVLVATSSGAWQLYSWYVDIEVLEGVHFNIGKYIEEEGVEFV